MGGRRELSWRELLLVAAGACLLAVVMHWPLVLNLGDDIPKDLGDPLVQSWEVAWGGHALLHQPLHFFDANRFWPAEDSLAYADALIGYAPAGLIGSGPHDAVVRYDLLFLFAHALAFFGAYWLARELGIGPAGAAVAGAAYAFAPFRLAQDNHLNVISSGGIPLCLALGVRGVRLRRPLWLFLGWLVAAWQLSLGFNLGLPLAYMLAGGVLAAVILWLRRGRPPLDRRLLVAGAAGAVFFVAVAALISRPYINVADENPGPKHPPSESNVATENLGAKRQPSEVELYSAAQSWRSLLAVFLTPPEENFVWGGATAGIRNTVVYVQTAEKTLFPGLLILGLALTGLRSASLDRRLRIGLGIAVLAISVLALGFQERGGLLWPYRVVYELLPGWEALRTPGRLVTFSSLGLALLAAAGAESALRSLGRRGLGAWPLAGAATVLVLLIAIEGRGLPFDPFDNQDQPDVPDPPASTAEVPVPQLHLPAGGFIEENGLLLRLASELARRDGYYLLWSTDGFPEIVNGRSSITPDRVVNLIAGMRNFPDAATVARLQAYGVRSVVLHTSRTPGTPQQNAARAPIAGLPLERRMLQGLVVYVIRSPGRARRRGSARCRRAPPSEPTERSLASQPALLDAARRKRLEGLWGWSWARAGDCLGGGLGGTSGLRRARGHAQPPAKLRKNGYGLGTWVVNQRDKWGKGTLDPERRKRLEANPGWEWQPRSGPRRTLTRRPASV